MEPFLYAIENLNAFVEKVLKPFLQQNFSNNGPWAPAIEVIAPSIPHLEAIKAELLSSVPLFGITFMTPSALRASLAKERLVATPNDERLALSLAGLALEKEKPGACPPSLFQEIDLWQAFLGRWMEVNGSLEFMPEAWMADWITKAKGLLAPYCFRSALGGLLWAESHNLPKSPLRIFVGFDSTALSHVLLFKAACLSAERVFFTIPLLPRSRTDRLWCGIWEEFFKKTPHAVAGGSTSCYVSIKAKTQLEATNLAIQALDQSLIESSATRFVLTSLDPSVLREWCARLEAMEVPYYDATGGAPLVASLLERCCITWLAYQAEGSLKRGLDFLHVLAQAKVLEIQEARDCERILKKASTVLQADNLEVLIPYLEDQGTFCSLFKQYPLLASAISPKAAYDALLAAATTWGEDVSAWAHPSFWLGYEEAVPRALMMAYWQSAFTERARGKYGASPFAPIWVAPLEVAMDLPKTLCIGAWSLDEVNHQLTDSLFDKYLHDLNQEAIITGSQGEGHETLKLDRSWASTRRERDLQRLMLKEEFMAQSSPLSLGPSLENSSPKIDCWAYPAVAKAYQERRKTNQSFGDYDFSVGESYFKEPLSCSAWEALLERPAEVWYQSILKLEPAWNPLYETGLSLQKGLWVHAWVQAALEKCSPEGGIAAALEVKKNIENAYSKANQAVPSMWYLAWEGSFKLSQHFTKAIFTVDGFPCRFSEWELPAVFIPLPGKEGLSLPIKGRVDLLLAEALDFSKESLPTKGNLWVVDFKTGKQKPLSLRLAAKGEGLQLSLYGLALKELGASGVNMSFLSPLVASLRPQLNAEDLHGLPDDGPWPVLARIYRTGILGSCPPPFGENTSRLPLATLPVSPDILQIRWELTYKMLN